MLVKKEHGYQPHKISVKSQNPYYYPTPDPRYLCGPGVELTLGDLHANTIALLSRCLYHNVLKMERQYFEILVAIMLKSPETLRKEDIDLFRLTLEKYVFVEGGSSCLLRLLGDDVADRNGCDLWTLLLYQFFHNKGIKYTIIFSNHGYELVENYETGNPFLGFCMSGVFVASLKALQIVIERGLISRAEVDELIESAYISHLELIDYAIAKDNTLTLFSHSYLDPKILERIVRDLNIQNAKPFDYLNIQEKISLLFKISTEFRILGREKRIHQFVSIADDDDAMLDSENWSGIGWVIWARYPALLNREGMERYVNGHDLPHKCPAKTWILDSPFGKKRYHSSYNKHFSTYTALYTFETKQLNFDFFESFIQDLRSKIRPEIKIMLSPLEIHTLFNEKMLYSLSHIEMLQTLLTEESSIHLWNTLAKIPRPAHRLAKKRLISNPCFRELCQLIHQLGAFNHTTLNLVVSRSDQFYKLAFQAVLLIADYSWFTSDRIDKLLFKLMSSQTVYAALVNLKQNDVLDDEKFDELMAADSEWILESFSSQQLNHFLEKRLPDIFNYIQIDHKESLFLHNQFLNQKKRLMQQCKESDFELKLHCCYSKIIGECFSITFDGDKPGLTFKGTLPKSFKLQMRHYSSQTDPDALIQTIFEYAQKIDQRISNSFLTALLLCADNIFYIKTIWEMFSASDEKAQYFEIFCDNRLIPIAGWLGYLNKGLKLAMDCAFLDLGLALVKQGFLNYTFYACFYHHQEPQKLITLLCRMDDNGWLNSEYINVFMGLCKDQLTTEAIWRGLRYFHEYNASSDEHSDSALPSTDSEDEETRMNNNYAFFQKQKSHVEESHSDSFEQKNNL